MVRNLCTYIIYICKQDIWNYNIVSILVYPILKMYDGSRGKLKWMKWLFYIYYPLHLAIIGLLRILMYGNVPLLF